MALLFVCVITSDYLLTEAKEKKLKMHIIVVHQKSTSMAENSHADLIENTALLYSKLKQLQSVMKARIEKEQARQQLGIFTIMMKFPLGVAGKTG